MICPYNRKSAKWVKQYKNYLVNEDIGIIKSCDEVLVEEYVMMECPKEQCGVWNNDKCNYNQIASI